MADYRLLHQVDKYLDGRISLEQLEDWLLARWRQLFALPRSSASELAGTIELGLAEIGDGLITEEEFRDSLTESMRSTRTAEIAYPEEAHSTTSSSSVPLTIALLPVTEPAATLRLTAAYT